MTSEENQSPSSPVYMPSGQPVPLVLTERELISLLRLDETESKSAKLTIRYYRKKGLLKGIRIGKVIRYTQAEVLKFLSEQTQWTNRKNSA
jgi:hypothetical protein